MMPLPFVSFSVPWSGHSCLQRAHSWRRLALLLLPIILQAADSAYFRIHIVDRETNRGVPLVALTTNNHITAFTDSNGSIAWNEPGPIDRDVYFKIESPGYRFPGGGRIIHVTSGGQMEIKIQRLNVAERLYRVTGQSIYRDRVLTGYPVPIRQPVLNAEVLGQDTVRAVPYRGKLFWLWGDTDKASGPLGNFSTTSATSELPGHGGLDPSAGIDLNYLTGPDGFVKPMCNSPVEGLKWLHALLTVRDPSGAERLLARYDTIDGQSKTIESGFAVFHGQKREFAAEGSIQQGKLVVSWKNAKNESGRLTCDHEPTRDRWLSSKAMAPQYVSGGFYTTRPVEGARPITRVWRNPSDKLMLDRGAQPAKEER